MSDAQPLTVVEGSSWPTEVTGNSELREMLTQLNQQIKRELGTDLIVEDRQRVFQVNYGLVGYVRLGPYQIHVVPKCFAIDGSERHWGVVAPRFLQLCRNLGLKDVLVTGRGVFLPSNVLLPWWAEYYGRLLWQALHVYPYLRYEQRTDALSYVRGQIAWPEQIKGWSQGDNRTWCSYRHYQADNPLNRLLKWAAAQLLRASDNFAARSRLAHCLDILANTGDVPPERRIVDQMRVPASMAAYSAPIAIARSLYNLQYPGLTTGEVPAEGFLIRMVPAFEAFVDGLIYEVVAAARRRGLDWTYVSQPSANFALSNENTDYTYTTRPDNLIHCRSDAGLQSIVIDAKYKGVAGQKNPQGVPLRDDMYQVFATCVAHQTSHALIISPALKSQVGNTEVPSWTIPFRRFGATGASAIGVSSVQIDLRCLETPASEAQIIERLITIVQTSCEQHPHTNL